MIYKDITPEKLKTIYKDIEKSLDNIEEIEIRIKKKPPKPLFDSEEIWYGPE